MRNITTKLPGFNSKIALFDGMSEMADHVQATCSHERGARDTGADQSFYGKSFADAAKACRLGDESLVAQSDKLLAKFESVTPHSARKLIVADVAGGAVNVPAFLAGQPLNMRRRAKQVDDIAPLTIYADVFASCGYSHEQIMTRGAACLALLRSLSAIRPVQLYVGCTSQCDGVSYSAVTRIDTQPLDLARAAYALAGPSFLRRVCFAKLTNMGTSESAPAPNKYDMRQAISPAIQGELMILPPMVGCSADKDELAWRDPELWIATMIREAGDRDYSESA